MRCIAAATLAACLPVMAHAGQVYEGTQAAALRCSNTLALTAVALARAELIGETDKNVMLAVSKLILDKHVSGTWGQKKAALRIMRDRRSPRETIADYRRNAAKCLKQFPIN